MVGRRSPATLVASQLTSQRNQISSACWRLRQSKFQPHFKWHPNMTEKSPFRSQDGARGTGYQPQNSPGDASPTRWSELGAAFDRALVLHQAGRLSEAEQMY